jgi:UDP-N-acetylglucosamine:LPS N-acetylglucosamine transferase
MIKPKPKLIRITTVPISLEKLLEGQLAFMNQYFEVTAISADANALQKLGEQEGVNVFPVKMTRQITPLKDIAAVYTLYRFFKREKPAIVHTHTPKAGIVGMLAAWLAGVPIIVHEQNAIAGSTNKILAKFAKRILCGFPKALPKGIFVGNPVRANFYTQLQIHFFPEGLAITNSNTDLFEHHR